MFVVPCLQVQTAMGVILRSKAAKALPCGVYGSFGWSGEAVDMIEGRLKVRLPVPTPDLNVLH